MFIKCGRAKLARFVADFGLEVGNLGGGLCGIKLSVGS